MGKVIDMQVRGAEIRLTRAQKLWSLRFPERLDASTYLADLSDGTVLELARLGDEVNGVIHDLVKNVLGLGRDEPFENLSGEDKLEVMDAAFFFIDQVRWEVMGRLGWIHGYAAEEYSAADLIAHHRVINAEFNPPYPQLAEDHPGRSEFLQRSGVDAESMLRAMIPEAVEAFGMRST
jgi:hypothetical protein